MTLHPSIECDCCGVIWEATRSNARANGWAIIRLGDGIERHACRDCKRQHHPDLLRESVRIRVEEGA